ncbi:Zinc finger, AN1-type [Cinara cedri]|uniref:Zinc finger, AN1-type n=1 Tax=Cinara cedri TaxID=506608 RepID=A0A5E4MC33_9HEMI|nr:Zinc finger, AN1-type [Cinara cedri]
MEFPDLGKRCTHKDCEQLDFLPIECTKCQGVFCMDHSEFSNHSCSHVENTESRTKQATTWYECTFNGCNTKYGCEMQCIKCLQHFCLLHRHHGCFDELTTKETKKLLREAAKKSQNQFSIVKEEADKKIEATLRQAELQPQKKGMVQQIRLMKLKGKALGDNKIPMSDRIYFSIHPPFKNNQIIPAVPLFTSKNWTIGRTIDLFASRLKIENSNNKLNSLKLHLFKLNDGKHISETMEHAFSDLISKEIINNGDSLILDYISPKIKPEIESDKLLQYQLSNV